MKFSAHSFLWTNTFDETHLWLLPLLKKKGFDGIEIARYQFDKFPARVIGKAIKESGLECSLCCGLTGEWNLISPEVSVRSKTLDFLKKLVEIANDLGSRYLVGPLCAPLGFFTGYRRSLQEWEWAITGLQTLSSSLTGTEITLAIEPLNRYQSYFLNTVDDAVALCQAVASPNIGVLFDIFHANIEEKNIPQAIQYTGSYLKHFHVCANDRGIPGTGHLPWIEVFQTLKNLEYQQWIVIESFNFCDETIAVPARVWRDLAKTPEIIAFEGINFLKSCCNKL